MKALKIILKLFLFAALLVAPIAARWLWFHRGGYQTPDISTLEPPNLAMSTAVYKSYTDQPVTHSSYILMDRYHENNLQVDDLTPLLDRLASRGASVKNYDYDSDKLAVELRGATAFLVVAPTYPFYAEEAQAVVDFVNRGGLLFLVADPTRSVPSYSESGYIDLYSLFFPESAVPAINSLANRFGFSFFEDYIYNLKDYDTNFRNVKFTHFAANPLTAGLKQVTLFAAHSLKTEGVALITGDSDTLSNVRTGETGLTPVALSTDGRVLALGDINILSSPYHRAADNDRFLANLADWLATPQRVWQVADFPYFFRRTTDLVRIPPAPDDHVIAANVFELVSPLQRLFIQAGKTLDFRSEPANDHDVIYIGNFQNLKPVQEIMASAGISVTLVEEKAETDQEISSTPDIGTTPTSEPKSRLTIQDVGVFSIAGTQLFLVDQTSSQTRLLILGEDDASLAIAVERLTFNDFSGCVTQGDLTLCTTTPAVVENGGSNDGATPAGKGEIFVLAIDQSGLGRSSGPEWENALVDYVYTIWYTSQRGMPTYDDMAGYKVFIVDTGDFAYDSATMQEIPYVEGNTLYIGEQSADPTYYETLAPLIDIQVTNGAHPLAASFEPDQVITLLESISGTPAIVQPVSEDVEGWTAVFTRGPESENAGAPVVVAYDYTDIETRYVFATFAFYRLPENLQTSFAINAVEWLLGK